MAEEKSQAEQERERRRREQERQREIEESLNTPSVGDATRDWREESDMWDSLK